MTNGWTFPKLSVIGQESFRIVAFTHLDKDHIYRASEFFWFDHAAAYQGGDRIKIELGFSPQ
ncbi:hypothetical protein ACVIRO_005554 [Rhizobium ruizarguesonis]|nr:hypothetical protein G7039_35610 [Rhizobium leguminosarum]